MLRGLKLSLTFATLTRLLGISARNSTTKVELVPGSKRADFFTGIGQDFGIRT